MLCGESRKFVGECYSRNPARRIEGFKHLAVQELSLNNDRNLPDGLHKRPLMSPGKFYPNLYCLVFSALSKDVLMQFRPLRMRGYYIGNRPPRVRLTDGPSRLGRGHRFSKSRLKAVASLHPECGHELNAACVTHAEDAEAQTLHCAHIGIGIALRVCGDISQGVARP